MSRYSSYDVRRARIKTLKIVYDELDWLTGRQMRSVIQAVADERYVQERSKVSFINEALKELDL